MRARRISGVVEAEYGFDAVAAPGVGRAAGQDGDADGGVDVAEGFDHGGQHGFVAGVARIRSSRR